MNDTAKPNGIYKHSEDIVARVIEDEIILVPLTSGIGDLEDELFTLNGTGRLVWERLDGKKTLAEIAKELAAEFDGDAGKIAGDVEGFVAELVKRRMAVEVS